MHISKIEIRNFRLLRQTTLDLREKISLLLGRNNCGKTSFLVLFENFYHSRAFTYDDFPLSLRDKIKKISQISDACDLRIQMILDIHYGSADNLESLSDFILDLDDSNQTVKILFECTVDTKSLLKDAEPYAKGTKEREKFIIKI